MLEFSGIIPFPWMVTYHVHETTRLGVERILFNYTGLLLNAEFEFACNYTGLLLNAEFEFACNYTSLLLNAEFEFACLSS